MHIFFILITIFRCSTIPICFSHQLFFGESFVTPGRHLISLDFLPPTTLVSYFKSPKLLSSWHLTFSFIPLNTLPSDSDNIWFYYCLTFQYLPTKIIIKVFYSQIPFSQIQLILCLIAVCLLPLSHYWNSYGQSLSLPFFYTYSVYLSLTEIST